MLPAMTAKPRIAIVGPGRLGRALTIELKRAGYEISEVVSRKSPASKRKARDLARKLGAHASTADNAIFVIPHAGTRTAAVTRGAVVFADSHLRGPLGLRFAPNGNLLAANGDAVNADTLHPSEIVEFTTSGQFVREYNVDSSVGGAFGLDTLREGPFNYAVIDDVTNNLSVYQLQDR